jgi:hypothetical protein
MNHKSHKSGIITSIDINPINDKCIKSSAENYLHNVTNKYDCIIFKYAFHFFPDKKFIINALKPNGKIYALSVSPNSIIPWNTNINNYFITSCNSNIVFPKKTYNFNKNINAKIYNTFLQKRSSSHLYDVLDKDINLSLSNCDNVEIKMEYYIIILDKNFNVNEKN